MPDIQKLYEEYAVQGEDAEVVILGAAAPGMGQEGTEEEITQFMRENGYTYPVLMDTDWEMFTWYGITSFPTTFMIDRDGKHFRLCAGADDGRDHEKYYRSDTGGIKHVQQTGNHGQDGDDPGILTGAT